MSSNSTWRTALLDRQHWMTFLLPFRGVHAWRARWNRRPTAPGGKAIGLAIPYAYYPWVYAAKIALTVAAVAFVWPGYRQFPLRLSPLAILVGIVGGLAVDRAVPARLGA